MKKQMITLLMAISMVSVSGCGNSKEMVAENESLKAQVESLGSENESLSAQIEQLNGKYEQTSNELKSIKESIAAVEEEKKLKKEDVTVTVIGKDVIPADSSAWRFNSYCTMVFEITNSTDKDIQGIEGKLKVMDLFGKEISTVGCDFTGEVIPSGQTITDDSLSYSVNEFIDSDMQFYNTDFKDLKFEYTVSQIVFTDGTVKK